MLRKYYILLLTAVMSLFAMNVFADGDVSMILSAPSTVEAGGKFRVQFTVNTQNVSNFVAPDFKGFEVIYGPATSSQSSFQIINGRTSQSSSIIYTYVLLSEAPGTYTIGSASCQAEGKTVKSRPAQIKVLPSGSNAGASGGSSRQQQSATRQQQQSSAPSSSSGIGSKDLFITATASRTNVYEQEAILLTYKIYTLVDLTQMDGKLPSLDGFQIQEINLPRTKEFQLEQYNGRNYRTVVWSQYVLFPQKAGKLTIPAVPFEGVVVTRNRNIDPFEAFFNGQSGLVEVKKTITAPALTINVSKLPEKPATFTGAVGKFTLTSSISGEDVEANEAVTLKLTVKGTGNMKLFTAPLVDFPKDFETYDAKVNDKFELTRSGLSGSKEFEYLSVPRHGGKYTIPEIKFTYFDTDSRTYKTLTAGPYKLNVKKGKGGGSHNVSNYSNQQQDVQELNQDIRYIKKGIVELRQPDDKFFGSGTYFVLYLVSLFVFGIILLLGHKQMKANANVELSRGKKANKVALKRLKTSKKLLEAHDQGKFYDEVLRALWGYTADKLNLPIEGLNKDNIREKMTLRGASDERIEHLISVQNECEFARYAPGDANENMENVYNKAVDAIVKMEDEL